MSARRVRHPFSGAGLRAGLAGAAVAFSVWALASAADNPVTLGPLEIHEGETLEFSFSADPSRPIGAGDLQVNFGRSVGGSAQIGVDYQIRRQRSDSSPAAGSVLYAARDYPDARGSFFITALADHERERDEVILLQFTDGYYLTYGSIAVTLKEGPRLDGAAGVTLSQSRFSLVEGHAARAAARYAVALSADPGSAVTITVAASDPDALEVEADRLLFTAGDSGNWKMAQTVAVRAVEDGNTVSEQGVRLTHTLHAAHGPYEGLRVDPVEVDITDAGHGVVVDGVSVQVAENGGEADYRIHLKSRPSGRVEIAVVSAAPMRAEAGGRLVFTPLNWAMPQRVAVIGKTAGDTVVSHAISATEDAAHYPLAGLTIPSIRVTVLPEDPE